MAAVSDARSHRPLLLLLSFFVLHYLALRPNGPPSSAPLQPLPVQRTTHTVLGVQLLARLNQLATHASATPPDTGIDRAFLSPAGARARALLHAYLFDAGLTVRTDAAGNVVGDLVCTTPQGPGAEPRKVLALGSHFDSVRGAGRWDGVYGVLAATAVAQQVAARPKAACSLPFDLRVLAFDDEEGNNAFGTTNFGAKAYAGVLDLNKDVGDLAALLQAYEQTFPGFAAPGEDAEDALERRLGEARGDASKLLAFIELHIEQGPVLERSGHAVGVVHAIAGQTRLGVTVIGRGGHAGTVPMGGRADALAAAAQGVAAVERVGREGELDSLVATVGVLRVIGGSTNVIPARVFLSVDVRAPNDDTRREAVGDIVTALRSLEGSRGVSISVDVKHQVDAVSMTPWVRDVLQSVVVVQGEGVHSANMMGIDGAMQRCGDVNNCSSAFRVRRTEEGVAIATVRPETMSSGAGHDTQMMRQMTDVGMVFVRCKGGVSHDASEHVSDADAYEGARILLAAVDAIAGHVRGGATGAT